MRQTHLTSNSFSCKVSIHHFVRFSLCRYVKECHQTSKLQNEIFLFYPKGLFVDHAICPKKIERSSLNKSSCTQRITPIFYLPKYLLGNDFCYLTVILFTHVELKVNKELFRQIFVQLISGSLKPTIKNNAENRAFSKKMLFLEN